MEDLLIGTLQDVVLSQGMTGVRVRLKVREVARRDLQPDAVPSHEHITRRPQVNEEWVERTGSDERRRLLRGAVPCPDDTLAQVQRSASGERITTSDLLSLLSLLHPQGTLCRNYWSGKPYALPAQAVK